MNYYKIYIIRNQQFTDIEATINQDEVDYIASGDEPVSIEEIGNALKEHIEDTRKGELENNDSNYTMSVEYDGFSTVEQIKIDMIANF